MQENFESRIREFGKLKHGWSYGKGEAFSDELIELSVQLAKRYFKFYSISVSGAPREDGAIDLMFNKSDNFLDMTVSPGSSTVSLKYCKGIGKNRREESWGTVEIAKLDGIMSKFNEISGG